MTPTNEDDLAKCCDDGQMQPGSIRDEHLEKAAAYQAQMAHYQGQAGAIGTRVLTPEELRSGALHAALDFARGREMDAEEVAEAAVLFLNFVVGPSAGPLPDSSTPSTELSPTASEPDPGFGRTSAFPGYDA